MSMFENNQYRWRETYFVLFDSRKRPTLETVQQALSVLSDRYVLTNLSADEEGQFDSLTLLSPDDFAALDICYTSGVEVLEHGIELAEEIERTAADAEEAAHAKQVKLCDARFDVLHFEQVPDPSGGADETEEIFDPSALLLVLNALAKVTEGIALDPQAGSVLDEE